MIYPFRHDDIEFSFCQTWIFVKNLRLNQPVKKFKRKNLYFTWKSRNEPLQIMIKSLFWTDLTGNIKLVKGRFVIYTVAIDENPHYFCSSRLLVDIMPLNISERCVQTEIYIEKMSIKIQNSKFFEKIVLIADLARAWPNNCGLFLMFACSATFICMQNMSPTVMIEIFLNEFMVIDYSMVLTIQIHLFLGLWRFRDITSAIAKRSRFGVLCF